VHDVHAAGALIEHLTGKLGADELRDVARVRIRVDAALSPESLAQAYEMLTRGTPLEGSLLEVEMHAETRLCQECGTSWTATHDDVEGHLLVCPSCGAISPIEGTRGIEVLEVAVTTPA
jgi:Zn finger protein HypA/HybF involved in hydrogenase expression